jgi:O-antigen/teichoic acid export membrane protein
MGGAISQVIVSTISSSFVLVYALKEDTFVLGKRESAILFMMPLIAFYEVFVPPYLDFLLLLSVILLFKTFRIITAEDMKLIDSFLPSKLKFVISLMKAIS